MNIELPKKKNLEEPVIIDSKNIVVIGANGAGKTRFGTDIETRFNKNTHRISAQKSLSMPKEVRPTSKNRALSEFLYGNFQENNPEISDRFKVNNRWGHNPNTFLLNDYEKLMVLLHTEEYEVAIKFKDEYEIGQEVEKPVTKLDTIQNIWEYVLPHRKLTKKSGAIEAYQTENPDGQYNASEMSDGERVVFYLIGEVISVPENTLIIIDEPENHLHKSIIKNLWDKIEEERMDCTFIYLTHDIDFASSRQEATKIWAKEFDGVSWDYEIIDESSELPEQLYLEILGSRKPILFIEGDNSSVDYKLLHLVFTDYTIKPLGSCEKVFQTTRAFSEQKKFHNIASFGMIDRDRRTNEEIEHIKNPNIWVAGVAEIENFLLLEEIVKIVARYMMKDPDSIFLAVKENVISFFESQIENQALEHTLARIERIFKSATDNSTAKKIDELENSLNKFWDDQNFRETYSEIKISFDNLIQAEDYGGILKVFNNKGVIFHSNVAMLCGLDTKNNAYLNYVISILKKNDEDSTAIKQAILSKTERNI